MSYVVDLKPSVTELDGYDIHGFEGDYIFLGIKNTGQYYEKDTLKKWTPLLGNVKTVLDIGANLGNHTLYWAKYLHPEKIVSFEPFPSNYEALKQNISDNGLDQLVTTEMLAVGESSGYVSVASIDRSNLGATSFKQVGESSTNADSGVTQMTNVDHYVQQHQLTVDFIKVDTEGFEMSVLKGAEKTIVKDKPALWVEVSESSHAEVRKYLEHLGYCMIDIIGFNILFLHQTKTDEKPLFDIEKIMDMMFLYQGKTNIYYANYIKAKKWLTDEKTKSQRVIESYETAKKWLAEEKEKSKRAVENCETAKKWLAEEKVKTQRATENYETAKKWLADEKVKTQRASENYETAKKWLAEQKEISRYAVENYEIAKKWLADEKVKSQRVSEIYETTKKQLAEEKAKTQRTTENYETAKKWLAAEKAKSQRINETYETTKQQLAEEKAKSQRINETYETTKQQLAEEQKARGSAEMQFLQLQFLIQQREEESYNLQRSLTQRIVTIEKDLKEKNQKLVNTEKDLKEKNQKLANTEKDLRGKESKVS